MVVSTVHTIHFQFDSLHFPYQTVITAAQNMLNNDPVEDSENGGREGIRPLLNLLGQVGDYR